MPVFNANRMYSNDYGMLHLPAQVGSQIAIRFAAVHTRDNFNPEQWRSEALMPDPDKQGWYQIDLNVLGISDGIYEYEFILNNRIKAPIADPFADEITRFGGYRGIFHIVDGKRWRHPFNWDDEFSNDAPLANNHKLIIYEMPMRWMESAPEKIRQVGLGTFEKTVFAHLDDLAQLGINAIELLPVQDSADTLNWGYGTRFFFAPDLDMGSPLELKFFVKQCHRRGIRVIFDIVMNHARLCPLRHLDHSRYFLDNLDEERVHRGEDYGAQLFRYWPDEQGQTPAREFQFQMAEHLIAEYHADGFRIDEFKGINNWAFIQEFREHSWNIQQTLFPDRPFIVIAEDSSRRAIITHSSHNNPNGRKVTDAMWNFNFRDELRRSFKDAIHTEWGQPSRQTRVQWMIAGNKTWDDWSKEEKPGFYDLAQTVNYLTSHDVEKVHEKRMMNYLLASLLEAHGYSGTVDSIRWLADHLNENVGEQADEEQRFLHGVALERLRSGFCLLLTAIGIPMILAGDEFGDVHDIDHHNWRLKMSDPVDWQRRETSSNNYDLWHQVAILIKLRKTHPALLRNEINFFYFHPDFNHNDGCRVMAYCRTRNQSLGSNEQVVIIANLGEQSFDSFILPWHWMDFTRVHEIAAPAYHRVLEKNDTTSVNLSLAPFQVRVFTT